MGQATRKITIALLVATGNLVLVYLFPPFDYVSLQRGNIATFAGFFWRFGEHPGHVVNTTFLMLEFFVILTNVGIAFLVINSRHATAGTGKHIWRNGLLWMVGINLIVMLLFPPFENYSTVSKTILPTFEGFYFVFADNTKRQLVTPILYIEIALLLVNAGLLLLFLADRQRPRAGI